MTRVTVALRMGLREYRRTPVLLALLVIVPIYVIGLFSVIVPESMMRLQLAGGTVVTVGSAGYIGALMAPMVGALIGGLTGLFVMQTTQNTDERLVLSGFHPYQIVLARLGLLAAIGILVTLVSTVMLLLTGFTPVSLGWFVLAMVLAALVYGMVGILAGSILDTLAGVYFLMFAPLFDLFLYQNPMATSTNTLATYLPGHFPVRLAMDAAFTGTINVSYLGWSLVVLVILTGLATIAFYRSLHST